MNFLDEHKEKIEEDLFERIKNLFNRKLDIVFYNTTSIYFEEKRPQGLAKKGFSKDYHSNHPEDNQVIIGISMTGDGTSIRM